MILRYLQKHNFLVMKQCGWTLVFLHYTSVCSCSSNAVCLSIGFCCFVENDFVIYRELNVELLLFVAEQFCFLHFSPWLAGTYSSLEPEVDIS